MEEEKVLICSDACYSVKISVIYFEIFQGKKKVNGRKRQKNKVKY